MASWCQETQKGRMPEDHFVKIRANFCYLVDHIRDPLKLANKLFEKNVFDVDEKDGVRKVYMNVEQGRSEAVDKLLMYVLNCGDAYDRFIQCLRELGYRDVVNVLENTTNSKNKTNLMTEQDKTRHQLEDLHKDYDLAKQELENLKKQVERQDGDSKQMLKKIEKLETYKKQTGEKEVLTKKRMDELETCIKTLTLNDEDTQKQQQLFDACLHGTLDDIKNMVNIDVNVRDDVWNQTPLFRCCSSSVSPVDKIKYLVSHQADINARDIDNDTILHLACYNGTLSTVQYLVDDLHMDVNTTGRYSQTPLFDCCSSSVSTVDKIKYLVSHGADINARYCYNSTILHQACYSGTLSTVQYLVDDLHMDVNTTGWLNQTPLFYCCSSSVSPVDKIKYLVSHGADINARDRDNQTILHEACIDGTLSTVQYLVDCLHLDLHVKNKDGDTPLDCCRESDIESKKKVKYIKGKSSLFRSLFRR